MTSQFWVVFTGHLPSLSSSLRNNSTKELSYVTYDIPLDILPATNMFNGCLGTPYHICKRESTSENLPALLCDVFAPMSFSFQHNLTRKEWQILTLNLSGYSHSTPFNRVRSSVKRRFSLRASWSFMSSRNVPTISSVTGKLEKLGDVFDWVV